jgi:hypothetical protein
MNSDRIRALIRFSASKTGVLFTNSGMPMTLIDAGRNDPRPASEYPHEDATVDSTTMSNAGLKVRLKADATETRIMTRRC